MAAGLCVGLIAGSLQPGSGHASGGRAVNGESRVDVDIDGDGRADLLIGSFQAIQVLYGNGLRQRITDKSLGSRNAFAGFGTELVACDVNGDGFSDAVAGARHAMFRGAEAAGKVVVFYGTVSGLSPQRLSVLSQESPGVPGRSEAFDSFGASLACGRVDTDRFDDVVVGVPGESWRARLGHRRALGRVIVVPGGGDGVVTARSWVFSQDSRGIPDRPETFDQFGSYMLLDDVTGDGWDELIVYAFEGNTTARFTGALFVLLGTPSGVHARGTTVIYGLTGGLPLLFGPIVAGNFDRRGAHDVIVNSPTVSDPTAGVTMLRGTPSGLTAKRSRTIRRDSPGMPRPAEDPSFGWSLAAGDVDGDGDDDLFVSSPDARVGGSFSAGRVFLIRGRAGGITTEGVQSVTQNTSGVPGRVHPAGYFGRCIDLVDLNSDGRFEAVIAYYRQNSAGVATILRATPSGLTGRGARRLEPSSFGAPEFSAFGCDLEG
jgi:hypothetical protein